MKKFSGAVALSLCLATPVMAADLPARVQTPVAPAPVLIGINWTSFYIGGHLGWARSNTDWTFFNGVVIESFQQSDSSWFGGGQAGYMFQFGNWVTGLEVSYSRTDLKADSVATLAADRSRKSEINDLLLVTLRLGYAWDRWLTYVKGGYANGDVDFESRVTSSAQVTSTSGHREHGWTVGAGFEYAFTQNISFGLEYNFVQLNINDRNQLVTAGFATPQTVTDASADIHTLWARLNFRFGGGPIVARY